VNPLGRTSAIQNPQIPSGIANLLEMTYEFGKKTLSRDCGGGRGDRPGTKPEIALLKTLAGLVFKSTGVQQSLARKPTHTRGLSGGGRQEEVGEWLSLAPNLPLRIRISLPLVPLS
jgi:hypothetical protein